MCSPGSPDLGSCGFSKQLAQKLLYFIDEGKVREYNWYQQYIVSPVAVLRWPFSNTCCTNPVYLVCFRKGGAFWVQWIRASACRLHCRQSSQSFHACACLCCFKMGLCRAGFWNIKIALAFRGANGIVCRILLLSRQDVFGVPCVSNWLRSNLRNRCFSCLEPRSLCPALVSEQYLGIQDWLPRWLKYSVLHRDECMKLLFSRKRYSKLPW